jgi:hypothetical protein
MNLYDELKFEFSLPDFLQLHRADTICPAPKMPFVDLGYFKDKLQRVEVIIQASAMQHETALEDYFTYFAMQSGEQIIQQRLIDQDPDYADQLLLKKFADGETWITRRTGFKTWMGEGAFVITLNMSCNEAVYNDYADVFFFMIHSFRMLQAPDYQMAEELRLVSRRYPLDFATYLPTSWIEDHHHSDSLTEMNASFKKSFRDVVSGLLNINVLTIDNQAEEPKEVLDKFLEKYKSQGLQVSKMKFENTKELPGFGSVLTSKHDFVLKQEKHKIGLYLELYLVRKTNLWLYIDLMGFGREQDFEAWAINKRCMQLLLKHFKTL